VNEEFGMPHSTLRIWSLASGIFGAAAAFVLAFFMVLSR
jgi:phage shock protein PspC (stress-responsive transcriptional regulator)